MSGNFRVRLKQLAAEVEAKNADYEAGRMTKAAYKAFVTDAHAEMKSLEAVRAVAAKYAGAAEVDQGLSQLPGATADYGRIAAPSPMDMTSAQVRGLVTAAQARTPFSVEIKPKSYTEAVRTKAAVTEGGLGGSFSGNLPPVQSLYAVGLGYEPTRIADMLPGAAMPGPSATWLSHTSNSAEVAIVAEGGTKGDISPTITENQVSPTKIAGQVSVTLEAFQDTEKYGEGQFSAWLPTELTRSLINEESNVLLNAVSLTGNATFNGILQTSGTLTRSMGTDSPLHSSPSPTLT